MGVQIVRFSVDESDVAEVEAALQTMYAAINRAAPEGGEPPAPLSLSVLGSHEPF